MRRNVLLSLLLATGLAVAVAAKESGDRKSFYPEHVRVAIVRDSREVDLGIHGSYRIREVPGGRVIGKGHYLTNSKVRLINKGILIGLNVYRLKRLTIEPYRDASILIDSRPFRGKVTFIRTPDNRLTVVNNIDVEDYVKGILYHEVSHRWPMEALKAQAVASRTYALYSINPAGKPYDVTNDIYSQVYGGKGSERYRTDLAVNYTRGQVLTYKGKIIPAFFMPPARAPQKTRAKYGRKLPTFRRCVGCLVHFAAIRRISIGRKIFI